jgi:hypothetical protein
MFEFRLRILDARDHDTEPLSYLGLVEGLPEILVQNATPDATEADLVAALGRFLDQLRRPDETRIEFDDFPTIRTVRLRLT